MTSTVTVLAEEIHDDKDIPYDALHTLTGNGLYIYEKDDSVTLSYRLRMLGKTQSGKKWSKWFGYYLVTLKVRNGRLYAYRSKSQRNATKRMFFDVSKNYQAEVGYVFSDYLASHIRGVDNFYAHQKDMHDKYAEAVTRLVKRHGIDRDPTKPGFIYPSATNFIDINHTHQYRSIAFLRESDMSQVVLAMFGKTRYRKDLVKAVANLKNSSALELGYVFRRHVPIDYIIDFYRNAPEQNFSGGYPINGTTIKRLDKALTQLTRKQTTKLFKLVAARPKDHYLPDLCGNLDEIKSEEGIAELKLIKFTSIKEFHDKTSALATAEFRRNRMRTQKAVTIKKVGFAKELSKMPTLADNIAIVLPETAWDVEDWGSEMRHCIGSYTSAAVAGKAVLFAVIQDGNMIANGHYENGKIVQLLGKYNHTLEDETMDIILRGLVDHTSLSWYALKRGGWGLERYMHSELCPTIYDVKAKPVTHWDQRNVQAPALDGDWAWQVPVA